MTLDRRTGEMISARPGITSSPRRCGRSCDDSDARSLQDARRPVREPRRRLDHRRTDRGPRRRRNAAGESTMGDVIADAQLEATSRPDFAARVVAFMNPGGIRGSLRYTRTDGSRSPSPTASSSPCSPSRTARRKTSRARRSTPCSSSSSSSTGSCRSRTASVTAIAPERRRRHKVDPATIKIGGATVNPACLAPRDVNSFLADGGDGFRSSRSARTSGPATSTSTPSFATSWRTRRSRRRR